MKRIKNNARQIWSYNLYGIRTTYDFSKSRVICAVIKQMISYFLWVFYSAYFVRFVIETIENERALKEILANIAVIGGVSLVLQVYQYLCDNVIFPLQDIRIYQGIYKKIYQKSENVELECFENTEYYNKFSIALDGIGNKLGENIDNISEMIGGLTGGILACQAMIEIDPWTILFLIAPLIGNFFYAPKMNTIYYNRYKDGVPYDRKIGYVNRVMYLSKYAKELRLYNIYNVIRKMFDEATEKKSMLWKKYFNKAFFYGVLQYIFSYVIIFEGILLYGAYRAIVAVDHGITFSQMAVLTSVMVTASWVWVRVIRAYNRNTEIGLVISDLRDFLEYKEKIPEDSDGLIPEDTVNSIEFRNVFFSYDGRKNVIEDMSFTIHKGDKAALVGHNGAGKTTLIKLLLRFYDPTEGMILLDGNDIRDYDLKEYRNYIGVVFQDFQVYATSIEQNVVMDLKEYSEEKKVLEAIKKSGFYGRLQNMPDGLNTEITNEFREEGTGLSGGEEQKLAVARTFYKEAGMMFLDEPSSALDPIAEYELNRAMNQMAEQRNVIFISHWLSTTHHADRIYVMKDGAIVEEGTHDALISKKGIYSMMWNAQAMKYAD